MSAHEPSASERGTCRRQTLAREPPFCFTAMGLYPGGARVTIRGQAASAALVSVGSARMSLPLLPNVPLVVLQALGGAAFLLVVALLIMRHRRHAREAARRRVLRKSVEHAIERLREDSGSEIDALPPRPVPPDGSAQIAQRPLSRSAARDPLLGPKPSRGTRDSVS